MSTQLNFFEPPPPRKIVLRKAAPKAKPREIHLNSSVQEEDKPRLKNQHIRIIERLRQGPIRNVELKDFVLCYTARLTELRQARYVIQAKRVKGEPSIWEYTLVSEPEPTRKDAA